MPSPAAIPVRLVIIGGGNMGCAIASGVTSTAAPSAFLQREQIIVCDPHPDRRADITLLGIRAVQHPSEALALLDDRAGQGFILLAVKPQMLAQAAAQLIDSLPPSCAIISILAGVPIAKISHALGRSATGGIIRAMPNTAVGIRAGISALSGGPGVAQRQADFAAALFTALGAVVHIDESLMDAFTALAGSGPAYLYYLAEAMINAGIAAGFDPALADTAVRATLSGAAALLAVHPGRAPADLRAAVTSRGGTTEAAIKLLDDRAVMQSIIDAITRARDRARELAG